MEPRDQHIIGSAVFDFSLEASESAPSAGALPQYAVERLLPLTEAVFDEFSDSGWVIRIDRLEVDLGETPGGTWGPEFEVHFQDRLRSAVREQIGEATEIRPGVAGVRRTSAVDAELEELVHFLRTGNVSWAGRALASGGSVDGFTMRVIRSSPLAFQEFLRSSAQDRVAIHRLVLQAADSTLAQALAAAAGGTPDSWMDLLSWVAREAAERTLRGTEAGLQRTFRTGAYGRARLGGGHREAIAHMLAHGDSMDDPVRSTFRELVQASAQRIEIALAGDAIRTAAGEGSLDQSTAERTEGALARLEETLRTGSFVPADLLENAWAVNSEGVRQLARTLVAEPEFDGRLASLPDDAPLILLLSVLGPAPEGAVLDLLSRGRRVAGEPEGLVVTSRPYLEGSVPRRSDGPEVTTATPGEITKALAKALHTGSYGVVLGRLREWVRTYPQVVGAVLRDRGGSTRVRRALIKALPDVALMDLVMALEDGAVGVVIALVRAPQDTLPVQERAVSGPGSEVGAHLRSALRATLWDFILAHLILDGVSPFRAVSLRESVRARWAALGGAPLDTAVVGAPGSDQPGIGRSPEAEPAIDAFTVDEERDLPRLLRALRALERLRRAEWARVRSAGEIEELAKGLLDLTTAGSPDRGRTLRAALDRVGREVGDPRGFFLDVLWRIVDEVLTDLEELGDRHGPTPPASAPTSTSPQLQGALLRQREVARLRLVLGRRLSEGV